MVTDIIAILIITIIVIFIIVDEIRVCLGWLQSHLREAGEELSRGQGLRRKDGVAVKGQERA